MVHHRWLLGDGGGGDGDGMLLIGDNGDNGEVTCEAGDRLHQQNRGCDQREMLSRSSTGTSIAMGWLQGA